MLFCELLCLVLLCDYYLALFLLLNISTILVNTSVGVLSYTLYTIALAEFYCDSAILLHQLTLCHTLLHPIPCNGSSITSITAPQNQ